jgi:hypothetical protein
MRKFLSIFLLAFCIVTFLFSCERLETLPSNQAKGKIIIVTGFCYGEAVIIEVNNPKGIGLQGSFSTPALSEAITYNNAIAVPYFSKLGLPDSIPQTIGTELYFEYREVTEDDRKNPYLFATREPIFCTMDIGPPQAKLLIITKVISYN